MDFWAAILIYLRGKIQYEAVMACRQIIVSINEGYKKIFHFEQEKDKYRNNSLWIKEIGSIINEDLPEYKGEYEIITKEIKNYWLTNFDLLKEQRQLSVHYDKDAIKVYKMFQQLNVQETFEKLIPFLKIINKLFVFTHSILLGFSKQSEKYDRKRENDIDQMISDIRKLKNSNNANLIEDCIKMFLLFKNSINKS